MIDNLNTEYHIEFVENVIHKNTSDWYILTYRVLITGYWVLYQQLYTILFWIRMRVQTYRWEKYKIIRWSNRQSTEKDVKDIIRMRVSMMYSKA